MQILYHHVDISLSGSKKLKLHEKAMSRLRSLLYRQFLCKLKYTWNVCTHSVSTSGVQIKPHPTPLANTFLWKKSSTMGAYRAHADGRLIGYPNAMNTNISTKSVTWYLSFTSCKLLHPKF